MKLTTLVAALLAALYAAPASAQETFPDADYVPPHTYLVTTSHTPDQCLAALDEMAAKSRKALKKMHWGCNAGDHTGYMIVDAADADAARTMLPESARASAKVIEVTRFTPKQLKAMHANAGKEKAK